MTTRAYRPSSDDADELDAAMSPYVMPRPVPGDCVLCDTDPTACNYLEDMRVRYLQIELCRTHLRVVMRAAKVGMAIKDGAELRLSPDVFPRVRAEVLRQMTVRSGTRLIARREDGNAA